MSSKYGFLSFLVFGVVLFLIFENYALWTQPIKFVPEKKVVKKLQSNPEGKPEVPSTTGVEKDPTSVKSYIAIAEKNIFSPERKDFPPPGGNGKKGLVRPQVVLYGVTILGDYQAASISNPGRPLLKGERETFSVKPGERIGDYKLTKILSDRITLEAEGDSFEVLLYDSKAPKKRTDVRTEVKPAATTGTQPGPAGPAPHTTATPSPTPAGVSRPGTPIVQGTPAPPVAASPSPPAPYSRRGGTPFPNYPSYPPASGNPAPPAAPIGPPAAAPTQQTQ
jgi:hypothetical protein